MLTTRVVGVVLPSGYASPKAFADDCGVEIVDVGMADNPNLDVTDAAHPAWWRGYDYGSSQWRMMAEDTLIQVAQLLDDWAQGGTFSGYGGKVRGQVSLLMQALAGIRIEKELAANGAHLKDAERAKVE